MKVVPPPSESPSKHAPGLIYSLTQHTQESHALRLSCVSSSHPADLANRAKPSEPGWHQIIIYLVSSRASLYATFLTKIVIWAQVRRLRGGASSLRAERSSSANLSCAHLGESHPAMACEELLFMHCYH